jgi:glyoxylase-like metal-dependent hydrolase (beta-lactamase superfamily II)
MASALVHRGQGFTIERIVVGALDNNVFVVTDSGTGETVIIDAADDPTAILEAVNGRSVTSIITTHGHWDHHQAAEPVGAALDAPFLLHAADVDVAQKTPDRLLDPGPFSIGDTGAVILHTPGHTPGSVCVLLEGVVLTGDTLFPGGPGATHFSHGSFPTIIGSIEEHLFTLPDDTIVFPGHGEGTTIGAERPQLPDWIERGW